jgi:hypothetical protein
VGYLLAMQHALDAEHVAAVCSIAARRTHVDDAVKHAPIWGPGYTLTLFVFASREIMGPQCVGARVMLQPEVSARGSPGTGAD